MSLNIKALKKAKKDQVFTFLKRIPSGKVTTYGALATAAGIHPRAVAVYMRHNKHPEVIPCYKVVRSDGSLGGYSGAGGIMKKTALLRKDGIEVKNGRIDLRKHLHVFSKS